MKLNRDFLLGAVAATVLIVPLALGLSAARAQNTTPASVTGGMAPGTSSSNLSSQLSNHWQAMLDQHQQMVEAQDSASTRLEELIGAVETADSDQGKLAATADLTAELARQEIDRRRNGRYNLDGMMSQMAMMGRMQGWMSDKLYQNSMMMMGDAMYGGAMDAGMMNHGNGAGGHRASMHGGMRH